MLVTYNIKPLVQSTCLEIASTTRLSKFIELGFHIIANLLLRIKWQEQIGLCM